MWRGCECHGLMSGSKWTKLDNEESSQCNGIFLSVGSLSILVSRHGDKEGEEGASERDLQIAS